MRFLRKVSLVSLLVILGSFALAQDLEDSNEDSPVLLTLNQPEKVEESTESNVLLTLNLGDKDSGEVSSSTSPPAPQRPLLSFISSFRSATTQGQGNRPSLFQAFQAGRGNTALGQSASRPSPIADAVRNFNVTARLATLRQRLGRFHIPRIQTSDTSLPYRAGRRVGLFFQNTAKRARALAERLRARAATRTPTVQ